MSRTRSRLKVTQRETEMRALLAECEESGQSKAVFARKRRLKPETFAWWSSEIRRRDAARREAAPTPSEGPPSFVEVVVEQSEPALLFFEIELGAGCQVRVPAGFSSEDLTRLLDVVGRRC